MIYSMETDAERIYAKDESAMQKYANDVRFSNAQLAQMRMGLESGVDISVYVNPDIPSWLMKDIRFHLQRPHNYEVRYTLDDGKTIESCEIECSTKQQAINKFVSLHKEGDIVDISHDNEL